MAQTQEYQVDHMDQNEHLEGHPCFKIFRISSNRNAGVSVEERELVNSRLPAIKTRSSADPKPSRVVRPYIKKEWNHACFQSNVTEERIVIHKPKSMLPSPPIPPLKSLIKETKLAWYSTATTASYIPMMSELK